jgi:hypothetical protein
MKFQGRQRGEWDRQRRESSQERMWDARQVDFTHTVAVFERGDDVEHTPQWRARIRVVTHHDDRESRPDIEHPPRWGFIGTVEP